MIIVKTVFSDLLKYIINLGPNATGIFFTLISVIVFVCYGFLFKEEKRLVKKIIYAIYTLIFCAAMVYCIMLWINS